MPQQSAQTRTETLRRSREEKFDHWFKDRHWRVCTEVSGNRTKDGHKVSYYEGYFQITPPGVFQTPLGHKGRAGYLVVETDADGKDLPEAEPVAFGRMALAHAAERYHAVTGLPRKDPKRVGGAWKPQGLG